MSPLYVGIFVVLTAIILVAQGIPKIKSAAINRGLVGASTVVCISTIFALIENTSPLELIFLTKEAQMFEVIIISIGYAFLISAFLGALRLAFFK